jgi:hypothetical protein
LERGDVRLAVGLCLLPAVTFHSCRRYRLCFVHCMSANVCPYRKALLSQGTQRYPLIAPPGQPGGWAVRLDWKLIPNRCVQEKFYQYLGPINNRHSAHCRCGRHSQNCERDMMLKMIFSARCTVTKKCQSARLFYLAY